MAIWHGPNFDLFAYSLLLHPVLGRSLLRPYRLLVVVLPVFFLVDVPSSFFGDNRDQVENTLGKST